MADQAANLKWAQLQEALYCPSCHNDLERRDNDMHCPGCGAVYPINAHCFYFREVDTKSEISDFTDRIKFLIKRFPRVYYFLIDLISPVLVSRSYREAIRESEGLVVSLGSGNSTIAKDAVNVDLFDYDNVDIVTDIHTLPFKDGSVGCVVNLAVLEHVQEPDRILGEVYRVLKPGGLIYSVIPFMQPFHASPHDYHRYTRPGIEYLHRNFELIQSGTCNGPVSGFLWNLQEFLALVCSLGWTPLRNMLALVFMLLLWPLKFLDLYFARLPSSENMASTFYVYARKPEQLDELA